MARLNAHRIFIAVLFRSGNDLQFDGETWPCEQLATSFHQRLTLNRSSLGGTPTSGSRDVSEEWDQSL
jgi:hypothetical protein